MEAPPAHEPGAATAWSADAEWRSLTANPGPMPTSRNISDRVDGDRLWRRLMSLARHGATSNGGVCRLALSAEEIAARAELRQLGAALGLQPLTDVAGNFFLRLEGRDRELPPLLIGSHIDSQPTGGKFDGAYGVVAALEAVEAIMRSGRTTRRAIEVVAWMNEEGSRFAPGMMGSAVFAGRRTLTEIESVTDQDGVTVRQALDAVRAQERDLTVRPQGAGVAGFVEAHIEQGVVLEEAGLPIGIVTGIQGKRTFRAEITGEEGHAGTTPRSRRRDALVSAVDIIKALQTEMWDEPDSVRFTIGRLLVEPNAPSVIPAKVIFSIDLRHSDAETVATLGDRVAPVCRQARGECDVRVDELLYDAPVAFPAAVLDRLRRASERIGLAHLDLFSPAGHDARYLSTVCPTGMIFVPCKKGISHNEAESITPEDAEAGARLLAEAAFEWADDE